MELLLAITPLILFIAGGVYIIGGFLRKDVIIFLVGLTLVLMVQLGRITTLLEQVC